jgi:hypothetical protein
LIGRLRGGFQFDELEQLVNALGRPRARQAENFRVEPEQFLGGEKFVVIGQLRQVADALAGDGLAHINAEQIAAPLVAGRSRAGRSWWWSCRRRSGRGSRRLRRRDFEIEAAQGDFGGLAEFAAANSTRSFSVFKMTFMFRRIICLHRTVLIQRIFKVNRSAAKKKARSNAASGLCVKLGNRR